jgi:imidazolonepropionase-like amidohydrolase
MATNSAKVIAITNVRVFDGKTIQDPSTLIINGDVIGRPDTTPDETIDAGGLILLPGLIDAHVHLSSREDLIQMAKHGITTAFDMATWPAEHLNSLRNQKGVTDIRSCGLAATAPGSIHSRMPTIPQDALVSTPDDAEEFVETQLAEGADYIKIIADVPGPTQECLDALVIAAHCRNRIVIAHAVSLEATRMAQAANVDVITHAPLDGVMSDADVQKMVQEGRLSIPTLTMMKRVSVKRGKYAHSHDTVAALHRAGVPILAGTDSNSAPGAPANVTHGVSLHEELELLVNCGLSNCDALRAATELPDSYFRLHDRGVIQVGRRADLVLVRGNPLEDICATRNIERVWIAGEELDMEI